MGGVMQACYSEETPDIAETTDADPTNVTVTTFEVDAQGGESIDVVAGEPIRADVTGALTDLKVIEFLRSNKKALNLQNTLNFLSIRVRYLGEGYAIDCKSQIKMVQNEIVKLLETKFDAEETKTEVQRLRDYWARTEYVPNSDLSRNFDHGEFMNFFDWNKTNTMTKDEFEWIYNEITRTNATIYKELPDNDDVMSDVWMIMCADCTLATKSDWSLFMQMHHCGQVGEFQQAVLDWVEHNMYKTITANQMGDKMNIHFRNVSASNIGGIALENNESLLRRALESTSEVGTEMDLTADLNPEMSMQQSNLQELLANLEKARTEEKMLQTNMQSAFDNSTPGTQQALMAAGSPNDFLPSVNSPDSVITSPDAVF